MIGELINGAYYVLGELKGSTRSGLWLAHSLVTGELVTLAVPAPNGESPTAEELCQEGEIFGEISSRYVQSVVDWDDEDVIVVWEYVPAWTLATAMRAASPPSVATVLRLMRELAQGLAAVHGRGAVYRGLHPGRILLLRDGTARLATTHEALLAKRGRIVQGGPPPETPIRYLAPEQIEGTSSASSDLYSLCIVAYELLTGHRSYTHADPVTLAVEIMKTTPPPPSHYRPDVPAEVDDLFEHCLARKPEDRPRNVASLVAYLNKLISVVEDPGTETLVRRLGLHPVAYPLLASDSDRAALSRAVSSPIEERSPAEEPPGQSLDGRLPADDGMAAEGRQAGTDQEPGTSDQAGDGERPHPAPVPEAFLVAKGGIEFPLQPPRMTVGRRGTNGTRPDIDLRDLDKGLVVSREHAALRYHDGVWHVLELQARNGTWVNDERLAPGAEVPLRSGDRVRLANLELAFEIRRADRNPPVPNRSGTPLDAALRSEEPSSPEDEPPRPGEGADTLPAAGPGVPQQEERQ